MKSHHHTPIPMVSDMLLKQYLELIPRIKDLVRDSDHGCLGFETNRCMNGFGQAIHLGDGAVNVAPFFAIVQNIAAATFRVATDSTPFTRHIWDEDITFTPQTGLVRDYLIFPKWKRAFDLSVMRRATDDIQMLVNVPETLLVSGMTSTPEFDIAYFRFLRHFFTDGAKTGDLLINCMEAVLKRSNNPVRDVFLNAVAWPELKLYEAFLRRDQVLLHQRVEEAVDAHHRYYGSKSKKTDTEGWISLPMMAVAAIVQDNSDLTFAETPYTFDPIVKGRL